MTSKEALEELRYGGYQQELYEQIEKDLEVLEILKKKKVDIDLLDWCDTVDDYNSDFIVSNELTQEEFDLVKDWLEIIYRDDSY